MYLWYTYCAYLCFVQIFLHGLHNQKTQPSVSMLLFGTGSAAGIIVLLLLSLILWKVGTSIRICMLFAFPIPHTNEKVVLAFYLFAFSKANIP